MAEQKNKAKVELVKIGKQIKQVIVEDGEYKDVDVPREDASIFVNRVTVKDKPDFMVIEFNIRGEKYKAFLNNPKSEEEKAIYRKKLQEAREESEKLRQ